MSPVLHTFLFFFFFFSFFFFFFFLFEEEEEEEETMILLAHRKITLTVLLKNFVRFLVPIQIRNNCPKRKIRLTCF